MKRYLLSLVAVGLTTSFSQADDRTLVSDLEAGSVLDLISPAPAVSADLENLALEMVTLGHQPLAISGLSFLSEDADSDAPQAEPDMATLYSHALNARRMARLKQGILAVKAVRDAQKALLEAADKSLVEREEARIEADTATPEASPTPCPFSLERPESLVSTETTSIESLTGAIDLNSNRSLACTPEPATWALFGLGAAFMIFVVPRHTLKFSSSTIKNNS
jgi:hypothetical protein